jgi:hypothetical protein
MKVQKLSPIDISEIEFSATNQGLTIFCSALNTPRFVPFEVKGRCTLCHSSNAELELVMHSEGVWVHCNRLKEPKFVLFDKYATVNDNSLVRLKTRNTRFNIPIKNTKVKKILCEEENNKEPEIIEVKKPQKNGKSPPKESKIVPNETS